MRMVRCLSTLCAIIDRTRKRDGNSDPTIESNASKHIFFHITDIRFVFGLWTKSKFIETCSKLEHPMCNVHSSIWKLEISFTVQNVLSVRYKYVYDSYSLLVSQHADVHEIRICSQLISNFSRIDIFVESWFRLVQFVFCRCYLMCFMWQASGFNQGNSQNGPNLSLIPQLVLIFLSKSENNTFQLKCQYISAAVLSK